MTYPSDCGIIRASSGRQVATRTDPLDKWLKVWYTALVSENALAVWDALKEANPEMIRAKNGRYYPAGFRDWLLTEFALGTYTGRIRDKLAAIRRDQESDRVEDASLVVWPALNKREIDYYHTTYRDQWLPIQQRISQNIENIGVLSKNARLLALLRTANELEQMMYEERNSKSGQLYLIPEYRQMLKQIAEEKGELGEQGEAADSALLKIAETLAGLVRIQGSGVQVIEGEFSYEEDDAEASVQG